MKQPGDTADAADLLSVLSLASDLGVGLPIEHGLRACYIGLGIAAELGLSERDRADLAWTQLLKDAGCTSFTTQAAAFFGTDEIVARREALFERKPGDIKEVFAWARKHVGAGEPSTRARVARLADFVVNGRDFFREGFQSAGGVGRRIAQRLGASAAVQSALVSVFEEWNGRGMPLGLRGEAIPLLSRIVFPSAYIEVAHRVGGRDAALRFARESRAQGFDPSVVDALTRAATRDTFWAPLERGTVWSLVKPAVESAGSTFTAGDFADACADFVDMKAFWLAGHSRRVADLGRRLGEDLGLEAPSVASAHLGGLLHDLGLVAVPSFTLNKPPEQLSRRDLAVVDSHVRHVFDLLSRVPELSPLDEIAAAHHKQWALRDGGSEGVARCAASVAIATKYDTLTHDRPGGRGMEPEQALAAIKSEGEAYWPPASQALGRIITGTRSGNGGASKNARPGGLTEREVDVLRYVAAGLSRREISKRLVISESTARTHLEHIYRKIGVSTRVGAALFAVENDLVG